MSENPIDPEREYFLFAGYFVNAYARVEHTLRMALCDLAGIDQEKFGILVGNPRSGDLINKVRKLCDIKITEDNAKEAVIDAFDQLSEITKLRDRVVHYGGFPISRDRTIMLAKGAAPTDLTHSETNLDNLWAAARDLDLIQSVFVYRIHPAGRTVPEEPINAVRREPWQYTPLVPMRSDPKSQNPQAQQPPPQS